MTVGIPDGVDLAPATCMCVLPKHPMATPAQSAFPPQAEWRPQLEALSRTLTALLVLTYGFGFVILSVYEAQFGIMQFNPWRARIFLVGFTFTVLTALPVAALHYRLAHYGPLQPVVDISDPSLLQWKETFLIFGFGYTAAIIAFLTSIFAVAPARQPTSSHKWLPFLVFVGFWCMLFGLSVAAKNFKSHPAAMTYAAGALACAFLGIIYYQSQQFALLTIWAWSAGVSIRSLGFAPNRLRTALDFRNWIAMLVLLGFYSSTIFELFPPKYGGGSPVTATLILQKPVAWFDSTIAETSLIDENDQGYYVVAPGKKRALFIPRNDITSVYYGAADDLKTKSKAP